MRSSLAASALFVILLAPAAQAQGLPGGDVTGGVTDTVGGTTGGVTDTVGGTTGGVTDTVGGTTGGVTDTVGGTTGGVTDTVGGTTGGTTDTVGGVTDAVDETTGGTTDAVDETTGGVTNTVDNVTGGGSDNDGGSGGGGKNDHTVGSVTNGTSSLIDGLLGNTNTLPPSFSDIPANLIEDIVDEGAASGMTPAAAEGWIDGVKVQGAYDTPRDAVLSLTSLFGDTAFGFAESTIEIAAATSSVDEAPAGSFFAEAGQIALEAAKAMAFPLALAVIVVGFLVAHGRFGRKDPKLVLAPIDTTETSLTFE